MGFGVGADYSRLPLNEAQFNSDFTSLGAHPTSATASSATAFTISTAIRFRIPGAIHHAEPRSRIRIYGFHSEHRALQAPTGSGTANQLRRRGAAFTFGGGLDKHIVDRYAIFAEAVYTTASRASVRASRRRAARASNTQCDVLKNTAFGVLRGGLRRVWAADRRCTDIDEPIPASSARRRRDASRRASRTGSPT